MQDRTADYSLMDDFGKVITRHVQHEDRQAHVRHFLFETGRYQFVLISLMLGVLYSIDVVYVLYRFGVEVENYRFWVSSFNAVSCLGFCWMCRYRCQSLACLNRAVSVMSFGVLSGFAIYVYLHNTLDQLQQLYIPMVILSVLLFDWRYYYVLLVYGFGIYFVGLARLNVSSSMQLDHMYIGMICIVLCLLVFHVRMKWMMAMGESEFKLKYYEGSMRQLLNRYHQLVEASNDVVFYLNTSGCYEFVSPGACEEVFGYTAEEMVGRPFRDFIDPEIVAREVELFGRLLATQEPLRDYRTVVVRPDGKKVHLSVNALYCYSEDGVLQGFFGTKEDVTAEVEAEHSRRKYLGFNRMLIRMAIRFIGVEPEDFKASIHASMGELVEELGVDSCSMTWVDYSAGDQVQGQYEYVWCRPALESLYENKPKQENYPWIVKALFGGRTVVMHSLDDIPEEAVQDREAISARGWKSFIVIPVFENGTLSFVVSFNAYFKHHEWTDEECVLLEVAASLFHGAIQRHQLEQSRRLLNNELDHRVKNNLASVLALMERIGNQAGSYETFKEEFSHQLQLLANLHERLAGANWELVSLRTLCEVAGQVYDRTRECLIVEGEKVELSAAMGQPMVLVLYELFTNAMKHGALKVEGGMIRLGWEVKKGVLEILWTEEGVAGLGGEIEHGQGMALITGLIEFELKGHVVFELGERGLTCRILIPLDGKKRERVEVDAGCDDATGIAQ